MRTPSRVEWCGTLTSDMEWLLQLFNTQHLWSATHSLCKTEPNCGRSGAYVTPPLPEDWLVGREPLFVPWCSPREGMHHPVNKPSLLTVNNPIETHWITYTPKNMNVEEQPPLGEDRDQWGDGGQKRVTGMIRSKYIIELWKYNETHYYLQLVYANKSIRRLAAVYKPYKWPCWVCHDETNWKKEQFSMTLVKGWVHKFAIIASLLSAEQKFLTFLKNVNYRITVEQGHNRTSPICAHSQ